MELINYLLLKFFKTFPCLEEFKSYLRISSLFNWADIRLTRLIKYP